MKSRSFAAFIAISALVVLTIPASTAQDVSRQADGTATTTPPVPLINQPLEPDAIKPGGAGFTLTVNGSGFVSGSVVKWNASTRATTFVSKSRLRATILATDIAKAGTASVTVVNPGPGGGTSNVIFFDVIAPTFPIELNRKDYGTGSGSQPDSVGVGDFNADGKLDLAVADIGSNTVTILLGNGDGTFQAGVAYATQSEPDSVIVSDFNGDGKPDVAVRNYTSNSVSILLGNGDGTFQAALNFPTGNFPERQATGDFNSDGKLDLAVTNGADNTVSILLGNGDGTFQAHRDYPAGPAPVGVTTGDFNGDGKLDLAVANYTGANTVSILLGNGDGTFQPSVPYAAGTAPVYVVSGDFNRDGKLDLAVANAGGGYDGLEPPSNTVSILLGNGDGTFRPHIDYAVGGGPFMVSTADIDADGKLDLAVATTPDGTVSILLGNGDGTFQSANNFAAGNAPLYVALADFNGDGRLDLAVAKRFDDAVAILLQDGTITLSPSSLNFGGQMLGITSAAKIVTLTNVGGATLTISGIAIGGTNAADFAESNTCVSSLAPKAHCTISVTFTPSQLGLQTASITVTDSAAGSPQSVPLSGFGVTSGPNATLSAASLTFSTQLVGTSSPPQSLTLSNFGTLVLSITSIATTGDFSQSHTCGSTLAPLASCSISVTFKPTKKGSRTGSLSIADNSGSPQTVTLTGTGTVVVLNPASLSVGVVEVGQSNNVATTLTNVGTTALSINGITITGTDADEFSQRNTCDSSVGPGKSCTITVTFTPKERGNDNANVSISDDGGGSPQQVPLSGAGCVVINRHCKTTHISSATVQSALASHPTATVPYSTGPSPTGTRVINLADVERGDPFLGNGTNRELLVRFWYPAFVTQSCKLAEYTSRRVWNYFSELTRLPLPHVTTNSCLDAPVANGMHPVVVFTPGYTGTFTDYTFLFEDLASRGYVVVSIDHTYEATAVEFPDGRFVKSVVGSHLANTWRTDDQSLSFAVSVRLDDLKFVLNELERLNASSANPFAGRLDMTKIALAGHSLGGLVTWHGVQQEARFKAGILLDPYLADVSLGSTGTPVMLLAMGHEQRSADECRLWSDLLGPRFSVNLRGSEHVTPSDAVWLAKGAIKTGPMGPEKTITAVRDYIAAFLDAYLRGRPADHLLTGPASEYPDAVVTTQEESLCRKP